MRPAAAFGKKKAVKAGQVLIKIDERQIHARLRQAQAQVEQGLASLAPLLDGEPQAALNLGRARKPGEQRAAS